MPYARRVPHVTEKGYISLNWVATLLTVEALPLSPAVPEHYSSTKFDRSLKLSSDLPPENNLQSYRLGLQQKQ